MKHLLALIMCLTISLTTQADDRMILITRHCQAGGDIRPIDDDIGISSLGIKQSQMLGQELKRLDFRGRIYASPYYRTVATACHAASQCNAKVYPDARVQERVAKEGGNLSQGGATLEQLKNLFPQQIASDAALSYPWLLTTPEDYEGSQQVRLEKALDAILSEVPEQDIMIVTHAGAVGALNRILGKRCGQDIKGTTWNCALFKYTVNDTQDYHFTGYDSSFMPKEDITSNMKAKLSDQKDINAPATISGVDAGFSYNFFWLSDTHFGDPESYDMNPETNPQFKTRKDIQRAKAAMPVYEALFARLLHGATADTRFTISTGDLIEGGGFNADTHAVQLQKAVDFVQTALKRPLYSVNGNHDSWGNGGPEAFKRIILEPLAQKCTTPLQATNFKIDIGPDMFIFADYFTKGSDAWKFIRDTIKTIQKKPRYLFVIVHPNLMPSTSSGAIPTLHALSDFNAIILCGHSHQTLLTDYERDGKKLTQLVIATFLYPDASKNRYTSPRDSLDEFWGKYEKQHVAKPKHRLNIDEHWKPFMKRVWWTNGNGAAQIFVSDEGIDAVLQSADITQQPFKIRIR